MPDGFKMLSGFFGRFGFTLSVKRLNKAKKRPAVVRVILKILTVSSLGIFGADPRPTVLHQEIAW